MQKDTSSPAAAAAPVPPRWYSAFTRAAGQVHWDIWLAIALTFVGWFLLNTLRVVWGPIDHAIPFYQITAVIARPITLMSGFAEGDRARIVLFSVVCVVVLLAPLAPHVWRVRAAWLVSCAPFLLIAVCAWTLYQRTSTDFFHANGADTLANDLRHFANHLFHRAGAGMARRVSFESGGYAALIGSAWLAVRGIRNFMTSRH